MGINRIRLANGAMGDPRVDARMQNTYQQNIADNQAQEAINQQNLNVGRNRILEQMKRSFPVAETFMNVAAPAINLGRGILGLQDPIGTPSMGDRMKELEATKGSTGSIGYEDYGLTPVAGRMVEGMPELALSNPVDFALAGSVGRYGFSPEGRTDLKYDFTPDQDTGSTDNAILDFVNEGGVKAKISDLFSPSTAMAAEPSAMPQGSPGQLNPTPTPDAGTNLTQYSNIPELTRVINDNPNINSLAEADDYIKSAGYFKNYSPVYNPELGRYLTEYEYAKQIAATSENPEKYMRDNRQAYIRDNNLASGGRVGLMGGSMPMGEPRVNQGGITELDFRAKGGFVPVGIKEKADDVPAMLSKNEFVFTADAVRGAGNGSIENGAQKMYDTMKNLERRVT